LNVSADIPALKIIGTPKEIAGFIYGFKNPSLLILLQCNVGKSGSWLRDVNLAIASHLERSERDTGISGLDPNLSLTERTALSIFHWMEKFYRAANVPVFEKGKIIGTEPAESLLMIGIPTLSFLHKETLNNFCWLMEVFNLASAGRNFLPCLDEHAAIIKRLAPAASKMKNTERLLKEALRRGIPVVSIVDDIYQYGYGSRSRLLESTFTDVTPVIGTRFARSKTVASGFMRKAGIPVPEQRIARNIKEAECAALELGFPLVVKPADLDGGIGVTAGIDTMEEMRGAFNAALMESANIVLERHFEGQDFRLVVFEDKLIIAVERVPGGVIGDGKCTVRQLVEQVNTDPNRGDGVRTILKKLEIDKEALFLLRKKKMDADDIPAEGEFVKLRRTANIAKGGTPRLVSDRVHPDNEALAIRAARLLGLDLAGIDLLIPDISRSWLETGCAICEVNAQPNLGGITSSHLYGQILGALVDGDGRIPVCIVFGDPSDTNLARKAAALLENEGFVCGIGDRNGVMVGQNVFHGPVDLFAAGEMLLTERTVNAVLLCINDITLLSTGLPFERFDLFVLAGTEINLPLGISEDERDLQLQTLLDFILPACDGNIIIVENDGTNVLEPMLSASNGSIKQRVKESEAPLAIMNTMTANERRHRKPGD
jgi:cyanophycin synthetase